MKTILTFSHLDKAEKEIWLPKLFDLLYDNMKAIAPSGLTYKEEKNLWLSNVSPAIDKAPRQIILCFDGDTLAGFIQYYIRNDLLMIEEIQLHRAYQRTTAFYRLCKFLQDSITESLSYIEAYADKRNTYSILIMKKLGMERLETDTHDPYLHFRGILEPIRKVLNK